MQCPPTPGAGVQDMDPGVQVREADEFPDVDVVVIADQRELVREGDVDVPESVLGELRHLGGARRGEDAVSLDENIVQVTRPHCALAGDAPDDPVVVDEFLQDVSREDTLGAVGDGDVRSLSVDMG